jgi:hypothetical protein
MHTYAHSLILYVNLCAYNTRHIIHIHMHTQSSSSMDIVRREVDALRNELEDSKQVIASQAREISQATREIEESRAIGRRLRAE